MIEIVPRKRLSFKEDYIYLNRNIMLEEHPIEIYDSLLNFFKKEDLHQYPDMQKTYDILGDYLKIPIEKLCITRGVEGAIKQVFETFNLNGKSIGLLAPTYAMYYVYAGAYNVNIIPIKGVAPYYKITIEQIKEILPKIKVLFLDNPKMHIPHCFTHEEIDEILALCKFYKVVLFLDEVYAGWEYKSYLPNIGNHENLIISSSFSKSGFPSIKTGWLVTNKDLKKRLEATRLSYELDYFSSKALEFLISNLDYLNVFKENVLKVKDIWCKNFSSSKYFKVFNSKGYVLRLYCDDMNLVKTVYNNLYAKKIVVNLIDNMNLIFNVTFNKKVEDIIFKEIK